MTIQQWLNNPYLINKTQFEKRDILKKEILTEKFCDIGNDVICFENSIYVQEKYRDLNINKLVGFTIGKTYKILDYRNYKIKVLNDNNKLVWTTINRFIYSIKLYRRIKLENIEKLDDNIESNTIKKELICVLCGKEWGVKNEFANVCENNKCNGYCTWGYESMKPEMYNIKKDGFWELKRIPKYLDEI